MYYFSWVVPEKGFEWSTDVVAVSDIVEPITTPDYKHQKPYLIPKKEGTNKGRYYSPLEERPGLFSEFAKLSLNPESILKFANKYGSLGISTMVGYKTIKDDRVVVPMSLLGEGLNIWQNEIINIKQVYDIWHYLDNGWETRLKLRIHWHGNVLYFSNKDISNFKEYQDQNLFPRDILWAINIHDEAYNSFVKGDVVAPAKYLILKEINKKLKENVSPRILRDSAWNLHPYIMPRNLLSALWLQFYLAVTGQKRFIQCDICGELIEIKRNNRKTKRAHEHCLKREWAQKHKAKKLHEEGKSNEEISHIVKVDIDKISKWIKEEV
jgi:hypothetical protein